ncbi:MAG TPA: hypothetical protein VEG27_07100 [Usitatibacter sp.]|nr:hypothetical protein [Usitatibacter sp.]
MSLLARIFGTSPGGEGAAEADPLIDRLVAATDRRLAYVKGYRERLRAPVLAARERMREAVARIPGPTEVGTKAWSADTTVRALFARAEDAAAAFSRDEGVRAFFGAHPGSDCFGMLALEQRERRVLTSVLQGESVQAEVARTTVSFTEPQILAPGAGEAAVREELVGRALEYLALRALQAVGAMRAERHELEKERALLQAELKLARKRGAGFGGMAAEGTPAAEIERDLESTVRELEAAASRQLLPSLIEEMARVLGEPRKYLTIEPCTLALDAMNFAVEPSAATTTPRVAILKLVERPPYAVLVARFPHGELRADNRLAEAEKFL